jgi:hypothetical protein
MVASTMSGAVAQRSNRAGNGSFAGKPDRTSKNGLAGPLRTRSDRKLDLADVAGFSRARDFFVENRAAPP